MEEEEEYSDQKRPVINVTLPLLTLKSIFDLVAWTETWVYFTFSVVPKAPTTRDDGEYDGNELVEENEEECILIATQPNGRSGMAVSELVVNQKSFKEIELWNTVETGVYIAMRSILDNAQPGTFVNMIIYNRGRDTPVESIQITLLTKDGNISTLVFSVPTIIDNKERELGSCDVYLVAHSTVKKFGTALATQNKMISSSLSQEEKKSMNNEYGPSLKVNLVFRQLDNIPEDYPSNEITRVIDFEYYSYEGHVNMCVQRLFTLGSSNNTFDKVESNYGDSFKIMFRIQLMLHSIGQLKKYPSFEKLTFQCRFIRAHGKDYDEPNVIVIESVSVDKTTGDVLSSFNGIFNLDAFPVTQDANGYDDDEQPFLNVSEYTGMEIHSKVIDNDVVNSHSRENSTQISSHTNSYESMCKKLSASVPITKNVKKSVKKPKSTKFTPLTLDNSLNTDESGEHPHDVKTNIPTKNAKKKVSKSTKNGKKCIGENGIDYEDYVSGMGQNVDYYGEECIPDDGVVDDDDDDPFSNQIHSSPSSQTVSKPKRRSRHTTKSKDNGTRNKSRTSKVKSGDTSAQNNYNGSKSETVKNETKTSLGKRSKKKAHNHDTMNVEPSQDISEYNLEHSIYSPPTKKKSRLIREDEKMLFKEKKVVPIKSTIKWLDGSDSDSDNGITPTASDFGNYYDGDNDFE